jgi:hypothetical protein
MSGHQPLSECSTGALCCAYNQQYTQSRWSLNGAAACDFKRPSGTTLCGVQRVLGKDSMANEFYSIATLGTLAGATGATVLGTNALKSAFDWNPRWLGLAIAEVICVGVLYATGPSHNSDWFIAVLNGCVVYMTATGTTAAGNRLTGRRHRRGGGAGGSGASRRSGNVLSEEPELQEDARRKPAFWEPWY